MNGQQPHQHIPYGRYYQTEHFEIVIKRCRFCDDFVGIESAVRADVPKEPIPAPDIIDAQ